MSAEPSAATETPEVEDTGAAASGGKDEEEESSGSITVAGKEYPKLADGEYDVIVLGTGLKETVLAGCLAMKGMRILQIDRNSYYGSETASLNLSNLYAKFRDDKDEEAKAKFMKVMGTNRDYNVDLIPKFMMADGKLVQLLVQSGVSHYLEFKKVDGSFVYKKGSGVHKMPATVVEAAKTSLMGWWQKRKFKSFLQFVLEYDQAKPATHKGLDLSKVTMRQLYDQYGLDDNSQDFTGHAMALHFDDSYLDKPALPTVEALKLYGYSVSRHGGKSPYIYPRWGLGGLPEGFTRKAAIHGATYMLNTNVDSIIFDSDGVARGVLAGGKAASAAFIIGEPSYFPKEKVKHTGQVVRSICVLNHPVTAVKEVDSAQIIIPQKQADRSNDIYLSVLSSTHAVVPKGYTLAIASTTVESKAPEKELEPAVALCGTLVDRFDTIADTYSPVSDGTTDRCFITSSYDASSHFETTVSDIIGIYERVTGEPLIKADGEEGGHK